MSNIEPSNNSSLSSSSRRKKLLWNAFKNLFILPIFSIGLIGGSGYLFYIGEHDAAATLAGAAVAAITGNNKDNQEEQEENQRRQTIEINDLKERLIKYEGSNEKYLEIIFELKRINAQDEQKLQDINEKNKIEKELIEKKMENELLKQEIRFLRLGYQQSHQLPGQNKLRVTEIEENVNEVENSHDDLNME